MANAALLASTTPVRELIVGYPGSAKTGSLACLANAGWKLRILDFDGNYEPLLRYCTPEGLSRIDIVTLEDKMRVGARHLEPSGTPDAFARSLKLLDQWKYKNPDGTETDLGSSKDWGLDTIVVMDSLTANGKAALRRAMALSNKTMETTTDRVYGFAMEEQEACVEMLTSERNRFHVIVIAHLKMIGPRDVRKGDSELTQELKRQIAPLVPTRLYPSALGHALPQTIAQHFPTVVVAETKIIAGDKVRRVLRTMPREELDLKVPSPLIQAEYSIETGQVEIFKALGHLPPKGGA